jgi:transcriptional regulator GlxA family with amidase domain
VNPAAALIRLSIYVRKSRPPDHTVRKLFRRAEGISLAEYWQRCRLQKAEELLSNPGEYIFEVA